jgi:hypothetical protein
MPQLCVFCNHFSLYVNILGPMGNKCSLSEVADFESHQIIYIVIQGQWSLGYCDSAKLLLTKDPTCLIRSVIYIRGYFFLLKRESLLFINLSSPCWFSQEPGFVWNSRKQRLPHNVCPRQWRVHDAEEFFGITDKQVIFSFEQVLFLM